MLEALALFVVVGGNGTVGDGQGENDDGADDGLGPSYATLVSGVVCLILSLLQVKPGVALPVIMTVLADDADDVEAVSGIRGENS